MIEFGTILLLIVIGFGSLIATLLLFFTGKKIDVEKNEDDIANVKIFNIQMKLVPLLYLIIILIMFVIGIFSDFVFNSITGLIFASIPFIAYWIFDYKKEGFVRK